LLLQLDRINYTPPNFTRSLLTDISFSLAAGECIAVTGVTGAGKSTLLRLINRLSEPTSGQILLDNVNYQTIPPVVLRRRVMSVSQEPKLLGMKVRAALAYPLQLQGLNPKEIEQRVLNIVDRLQIPSEWFDLTELQLSAGQKQLISIARGLIIQPQILLLDEPIANLDFTTAARILETITNITKTQQMGLVIVSHQLELAIRFSDRSIYLQDGKILFDRDSRSVNWQDIQQKIHESECQTNDEWE
jgi:D-methionine transport system ATP-binding protein